MALAKGDALTSLQGRAARAYFRAALADINNELTDHAGLKQQTDTAAAVAETADLVALPKVLP